MFFMHVAGHTSILTNVGARWTMVLDVLALLLGSVAVLSKFVAKLERTICLNSSHDRFCAESAHVSIEVVSTRFGYSAKIETCDEKFSSSRRRLNSSTQTISRTAQTRDSSQLQFARSTPGRRVPIRPPSQSPSCRIRLRSDGTLNPTKRLLVSTFQTSMAPSRCLFLFSETYVSTNKFRVQALACSSARGRQAAASTQNFHGTPGQGTKLRRDREGACFEAAYKTHNDN